jgi:hypothetical protein
VVVIEIKVENLPDGSQGLRVEELKSMGGWIFKFSL